MTPAYRHALERQAPTNPDQTEYYIARTKWTTQLPQATLFINSATANDEITLLPDSHEQGVIIRAITLTPAHIVPHAI